MGKLRCVVPLKGLQTVVISYKLAWEIPSKGTWLTGAVGCDHIQQQCGSMVYTVGYLVSEGVRVSLIASQSSFEMVGKAQLKSISCCLSCVEVVQTCCLFFC